MIALDYELDTSTAAGELAASALIRVGDWERGQIAERTRPGLTAIRTTAAKPASVRDDPQLSARIGTMRAQGLSLQAISDTLNAEGVPTLRGGTHWRPSSVQAATGYKRPPAKPAGRELPPLAPANATNAQGRWTTTPPDQPPTPTTHATGAGRDKGRRPTAPCVYAARDRVRTPSRWLSSSLRSREQS